MRACVADLLSQRQYDSAEALASLCVSGAKAFDAPQARAEDCVLRGDALTGMREYYRAVESYTEAAQLLKFSSSTRAAPLASTSDVGVSRHVGVAEANRMDVESMAQGTHASISEASIRSKLAYCYRQFGDNRSALAELEAIPPRHRTLSMSVSLGDMYRRTGYERAAAATYKECLRQCPLLLEVLDALMELGVPHADIHAIALQQAHEHARWLGKYVEAQSALSTHDYHAAIAAFSELLTHAFPDNTHMLLGMARAQSALHRASEAIRYYRRVRTLDPFNMKYMDLYAALLRSEGEMNELSKLTVELMKVDASRPESWATASMYWDACGDKQRAMASADRGLRVDNRSVTCYLLKGRLSLGMKRVDQAILSYRAAKNIRADMPSYYGLVKSYIVAKRYKEALFAAKDAVKEIPTSARALALLGDVHAQHSQTRGKARQLYDKALALDPICTEAVLSLCDLEVAVHSYVEAMSLLKRHVSQSPSDVIYVKLGNVCASWSQSLNNESTTSLLDESLGYFQEALRMNPNCEAARRGVVKIEKLMKGMDPDAGDGDLDEGDDMDAEAGDVGTDHFDSTMDMDLQWIS